MHDDYIAEYSVNLKEEKITIKTQKDCKIEFGGVLTHSFKCILAYNQILDISECEMSAFFCDNQEELSRMRDNCWPIDYQTTQELSDFLTNNRYRYIKIYSSYGMFGWVLAKTYIIDLREK